MGWNYMVVNMYHIFNSFHFMTVLFDLQRSGSDGAPKTSSAPEKKERRCRSHSFTSSGAELPLHRKGAVDKCFWVANTHVLDSRMGQMDLCCELIIEPGPHYCKINKNYFSAFPSLCSLRLTKYNYAI